MALPRQANLIDPDDPCHLDDNRVAAMHDAIEQRMMPLSSLPQWTIYGDARSAADDTIRHFSRAVGVFALAAGSMSVIAIIVKLI